MPLNILLAEPFLFIKGRTGARDKRAGYRRYRDWNCTGGLPRIFEKGYTGYNGHADKRSTGIGLYLCRKIMRKLSHEITIESEIGVGTKVHLKM